MVFSSLVKAAKSYVSMPVVWINGIVAAVAILAAYYFTYSVHELAGLAVILGYFVISPFFLAGTYGVLLDNNKKRGAFWIYARYGYRRCLFPNILIALLTYLLMNVLTTVLLMFGVSAELAVYISLFVVIPIIFFCYFADITAIRHNLTMGQALKDSAKRVAFGSFAISAFYLMNIALVIFASFILSMIMSVVGYEALLPLLEIGEDAMLTMPPEELIAIVMTPEIIMAVFVSLAVTALLFMPLFVSYKTYFFQKMLTVYSGTNQHQPDIEDGEYDEKGRWFKYK